jgi:hypothetical protein
MRQIPDTDLAIIAPLVGRSRACIGHHWWVNMLNKQLLVGA